MTTRRSFLPQILAAGVAPLVVPARLLRSQTAPSNKITLGVIGAGAQGTGDMRAFLNDERVRVVAVCDVNQQHIERARGHVAKAYGKDDLQAYSDFRELNRSAGIDAVLMALPVHWHSIPSADAILNGKHIYHEKPMGMSFEESKAVRAAVKKTGVVFQFGTQQRSDMYFRWASELALNGRLGKLKEIQVAVEGGRQTEVFPEQPVPSHLDWERWVGPAPMTSYHANKIQRSYHENMAHFSLGMISCWGIHHLDIAQWGNGTDATGPISVEGSATYPEGGSCDAVLSWKVRMEYAKAAPVVFATQGSEYGHGVRFIGEDHWVHVVRGSIKASSDTLLKDPQNRMGEMPIRLPVSKSHTGNFIDAIISKTRAICDIDSSVRSDMLPQLTAMALKAKRKLSWNPEAEDFGSDAEANALLAHRPFRGDWKLPG